MSELQLRLFMGDPSLCERALAARHEALRAEDPEIERWVLFADEADIAALDAELRTGSLFALGRHFVLRRADAGRNAAALAKALSRPIPDATYVSLISEPLRATHAVVKQLSKLGDAVVSLPTPKGQALQREMRERIHSSGLKLSAGAVRMLCAACGNSLLSLDRELEKLQALSGGEAIPDAEVQRVGYDHADAALYPFYDRIGERQLPDALRELDALREDPTRILTGIVRHISRLVMVRLLIERRCPPADIASKSGMPPWMCRRFIEQARDRSLAELADALHVGVQCDQRIKQGRIAPADALMQYVLVASGATDRR